MLRIRTIWNVSLDRLPARAVKEFLARSNPLPLRIAFTDIERSDRMASLSEYTTIVSAHVERWKTCILERVSEEELALDPCVRVMKFETEESKKVTRNKGNKYVAVFRRKADPEWPA